MCLYGFMMSVFFHQRPQTTYEPSVALTPKILSDPVCCAWRCIAPTSARCNLAKASGVKVSCFHSTCFSLICSTHPTKWVTNSWKKCSTCRYLQVLLRLIDPSDMLFDRQPSRRVCFQYVMSTWRICNEICNEYLYTVCPSSSFRVVFK